ncbi:MAG: hypothetical protein SGPRY_006759, partial [Prymnesium sp.]
DVEDGGIDCSLFFKFNCLVLLADPNSVEGFPQNASDLTIEYVHIRANSATVRVGERVRRGQKLCESGDAGFCPTPHLHIQAQNPNQTITLTLILREMRSSLVHPTCMFRHTAGRKMTAWMPSYLLCHWHSERSRGRPSLPSRVRGIARSGDVWKMVISHLQMLKRRVGTARLPCWTGFLEAVMLVVRAAGAGRLYHQRTRDKIVFTRL